MAEPEGSNRVSGAELQGFIERLERVQAEKAARGDDEKAIFAEAKAAGYGPKYIRALLRLRRKPPSEREEEDAMLELYMGAVGMTRDIPLFRHIEGMGVDVAARESVIAALKLLAPTDGEITIKAGPGPRIRIWRDAEGVNAEEVTEPPPGDPAPAKRAGAARPGAEAPDCTEAEAFALGQAARKADRPIVANPFAWDDARRRSWDEGWRAEDGGDGMGPK